MLSIIIHCSFFSFLSLFKTPNMRLCLLLFFSTVAYAVTRIVEPDFEGVNFAAALFGRRLDKVFQETAVDSETSCQIQCVKNIRCLSYNLGTTNEKGNLTCQLSDSDRFTAWGSCVSRFAFTFQAFPVIVRDADRLFSTRIGFRFASTLFSYTIRKREEKMCHK